MRLSDLSFVDLYLGEQDGLPFCDVKILPGADAARVPIGAEYREDVARLLETCEAIYIESQTPEFSVEHDSVRYRVTVFDLARGKAPFYTVSRVSAKVFSLKQLFLPEEIEEQLLSKHLRGLVLFVGSMSSGKTTSGHSLLSAWLKKNGGLAMAIEDPIENDVAGMHGEGRCIQVEVSRHRGGYAEALTKALRARVGTVLVGEIRGKETAEGVLTMANTDHLVIATMHASSPTAAVELLYTYGSAAGMANAASLVARGLSLVIWQKIERHGDRADVYVEPVNLLDELTGPTIRTLIMERSFHALHDQFKKQFDRALKG